MKIGVDNQDIIAQYEALKAQQEELTKQADFMSSLLSDVKSTSEKYEAELNAKRQEALAEIEQVSDAVTKLKEQLETTTLDLTEQVEQGWANRLAVDDEFAKFCEANKSYVTGLDLKARARMLSSDIAEIKRIYREQQIDAKRQAVADAVTEAERQFDEIEQSHKISRDLLKRAFKIVRPLNDEAKAAGLGRGCQTSKRIAALWARYDQLKVDCPDFVTTKPKNKMAKAMEDAKNVRG